MFTAEPAAAAAAAESQSARWRRESSGVVVSIGPTYSGNFHFVEGETGWKPAAYAELARLI